MKFYRMPNGDVVANPVFIYGKFALGATCLYDAALGCYCFKKNTYTEGVVRRLKPAEAVVLRNQLNTLLQKQEVIFKEPKKMTPRQWLLKAKEVVHAYTA